MVVDSGTPTGLMGWITNYGNVVFFFGQLAFWLALSVAAIWSTLLFRRLVNGKLARRQADDARAATAAEADGVASGSAGSRDAGPTAAAATSAAKGTTTEPPSIQEFVD